MAEWPGLMHAEIDGKPAFVSSTQDVSAQDVYQNTPLHYLASDMWPNKELLKRVGEREGLGGEAVWKNRAWLYLRNLLAQVDWNLEK